MTAPRPLPCRWPAPPGVRAFTTTREGGFSRGPFAGFNLADHVGDDPAHVAANRRLLGRVLDLPAPPHWLRQVHGTRVVPAGAEEHPEADGCFTRSRGVVCAVLTADCLPVLLCDAAGTQVAAVHAGWRGLAAGALEAGVAAFEDPATVHAWLGPAIGPAAFEIGADAYARLAAHPSAPPEAFRATGPGRWHGDLPLLARRRLAHAGVRSVSGGDRCTHGDPGRFYSYRRDGTTGRTATLIWLA